MHKFGTGVAQAHLGAQQRITLEAFERGGQQVALADQPELGGLQ